MLRWAWVGVGLAGALACGDSFTVASDAGGGGGTNVGGSGGDVTSNGGGKTCNDGLAAPPTPSGWEGPVVVALSASSALPQCPNGGDVVTQTEPANPATDCDCDCGFDTSQCKANMETFDSEGCQNSGLSEGQVPAGCTDMPGGAMVPASMRFKGSTSNATCGVGNATAPVIAQPLLRCSVLASGGCIEAPEPRFEQRACVWQSGDATCPDSFPKRWSTFTIESDQRTCECQCTGDPAPCAGKVAIHSNDSCSSLVDSLEIGECGATPATVALDYTPSPDVDACAQTEGTVHNDVVKANQATICCTGP